MARLGRARIPAIALAKAIGLAPGDTVSGLSFDPATQEAVLLIAGEAMPEAPIVQTPRGPMPYPSDVALVVEGDGAHYVIDGVPSPAWQIER